MTYEALKNREQIIQLHKKHLAETSVQERLDAAKRVESYFVNTHGDKISDKEKIKL